MAICAASANIADCRMMAVTILAVFHLDFGPFFLMHPILRS